MIFRCERHSFILSENILCHTKNDLKMTLRNLVSRHQCKWSMLHLSSSLSLTPKY